MPIASFGKKVFRVSSRGAYTMDGLSWNSTIDSEAQEKLGNKPSTYIKGLGLTQMSLSVPLRVDFGHNVRAEIEAWEEIRDRRSPDIFILGTKPLGKNKWLLKSVAVEDTVIDGQGRILRATLKLEFEEYVRAGSKPPETATTTAAGITSLNLAPNIIFDPPEKASQKRINQNYAAAMQSAFESGRRGL